MRGLPGHRPDRSTGGHRRELGQVPNAEEAAYKLNLEAAREIARQLRIRDMGGVIVMDFVDMRSEKHRRGVEDMLRTELKKDRARRKMLKTSRFGLIEMTRQRMRPSIERSTFMECPHCRGSGLIKTPESMSLEVMRRLALAVSQEDVQQVEVTVHPKVGHHIHNRKRRALVLLEEQSGKRIMVISDPGVGQETVEFHCQDSRGISVKFDPQEAARRQHAKAQAQRKSSGATKKEGRPATETAAAGEPAAGQDESKPRSRSSSRRRRRKKTAAATVAPAEVQGQAAEAGQAEADKPEAAKTTKRRRRRRKPAKEQAAETGEEPTQN
ncbi:MAG: hypothetical protein GWP05_11440 [Anaerolineaceae bacterium]|nr:hypothetical protein [Anaerolineaceae bacterium]